MKNTSYTDDVVRVRAVNITEALMMMYEHLLQYNTLKTHRDILSIISYRIEREQRYY